jgi:hypothetical protein
MAMAAQDRPCIHVCFVGGVDEGLYRWVEIGAEEEGVPTRKIAAEAVEPVPAAYEAAQSSRFEIGVSVAPGKVVLHERHMAVTQPVLSFDTGTDPRPLCRLMGSNAARMVVHLPFRFGVQEDTADMAPRRRTHRSSHALSATTQPMDGPIDVKTLATIIARILKERGIV